MCKLPVTKTYALYFFLKCGIFKKGFERIMNNALMTPRKNKRSEASKVIAQAIIDQYKPTSTSFIRNQLRNSFSFPNYITPISVYQRHTYTPPQNMIYIF